MARFTVTFTDEQTDWIEREAEARNRKKAWVVRTAVDAARGAESVFTGANHTEPVRTGANHTDRVDELEQRLADLEDVVAARRRGAPDANVAPGSNGPARAATDTAAGDLKASPETPQSSPEHSDATEGETSDPTGDHTGAASVDSEAALQDLSLPGSGDVHAARRETIGEMYSFLRDRAGEIVETGALKALVDPDHVGYGSVDSFWTNAVKKNASQDRPNALTALPGVRELGNGRYQYRPE